jgi:hypothetical protein
MRGTSQRHRYPELPPQTCPAAILFTLHASQPANKIAKRRIDRMEILIFATQNILLCDLRSELSLDFMAH